MRSIQFLLIIALGVCCCQVACATTSAELCSYPGVPIPDGGGTDMYAADSLYLSSNLVIEDVKIEVKITHSWIGDLAIAVLSPAGTVVVLYDEAGAGDGDVDIDVIFSDAGSAYDSESWVCGCEVMPSGPGTLADFDGEASAGYWSMAVFDFVVDYSGTFDSWCVTVEGCTIFAPRTVYCSVESGVPVVLWSAVDPVPDELLLYRDEELLASLSTDATRYEEDVDTAPGLYVYELKASKDGCSTKLGRCGQSIDGDVFCTDGPSGNVISNLSDPVVSAIYCSDTFAPAEITVSMEISHSWAGDLEISVESPDDTEVALFDKSLGSPDTDEDDIALTFADHGAPHGSVPLTCNCFMRPVAGSMSDLVGASAKGAWILTVKDPVAEEDGTLLDWCVTVYAGGVSGPTFLRGDVDGNGHFSGLSDSLFLLHYSFTSGSAPPCLEAADADGNGSVNGLLDALRILNHAFVQGAAPPEPYPDCGTPASILIGCGVEPDCS